MEDLSLLTIGGHRDDRNFSEAVGTLPGNKADAVVVTNDVVLLDHADAFDAGA